MKTTLTITVTKAERYIIARYFAKAAPRMTRTQKRRLLMRATRAEVRRFVEGAFALALRERGDVMTGREAATVRRLRGVEVDRPELTPPEDRNRVLEFEGSAT